MLQNQITVWYDFLKKTYTKVEHAMQAAVGACAAPMLTAYRSFHGSALMNTVVRIRAIS